MIIKEHGTILIPIDYSKQSLVAIKSAYGFGRFTKAKLLLMHVFHKPEEENKAALEKLAQETAAESGLPCDFTSLKGDIFDETDKMAEKVKASLIVAGLEPHVRFRNSFLGGSTASKFIKNSPCPVLTTRATTNTEGCQNIVMPFDTSAESREKVGAVIQIAHYFNATIRIVSVFDPNNTKYENELLPYLHQVKKYIKEKNVNCTNKSIPGKDVAQAIVEYANSNNCDLIVQMNKKDTSIGEMFSGTMSQKLVDVSNIPVLTINPMKRESISSGIH